MSKRKAGVNDIIYELDNDDLEISSDEENKVSKIIRLDEKQLTITSHDNSSKANITLNVVNEDLEGEKEDISSSVCLKNGGKDTPTLKHPTEFMDSSTKECAIVDDDNKTNIVPPNITIFNDDVVDSPVSNSNSDLGVVGCENKTPLVTVKFKDMKLANAYKNKVKAFMLELIKLHDENSLLGSETETDLELDIWPEDLTTDYFSDKNEDNESDLFFVDKVPNVIEDIEIPQYEQVSAMISNLPQKEPTRPPAFPRLPTCFNCDGTHPLRDCKLPRNNTRIAEKRKNIIVKLGRYHVEDEQKYGHLVPGRISGPLRHALGLKRHELPLHIYRMRELGYPPGWLEEARIKHSGITMFGSSGNAILEPDEEEGEVCEPGSKDKFDIKKILDFPGFNVPASSRYKEEAHLLGLPPMSEQDSKMAMLQLLAPNAMKAYKRKKLTFFPSASVDSPLVAGQAEMDLDSEDENTEFPSVPPLPDELPPPPPPPPDTSPPPPPDSLSLSSPDTQPLLSTVHLSQQHSAPNSPSPSQEPLLEADRTSETLADDLEIIEVTKIRDIPVPSIQCITIDDDDDKSQLSNGRDSPTLDALEEKKRLLLTALESDEVLLVEITSEAKIDERNCSVNANTTDDKSCDNAIDNVCDHQHSTSNIIDKKVENQKVQSDKNHTVKIDYNNIDQDKGSSDKLKYSAIQENVKGVAESSSETFENISNSNAMEQSTTNTLETNNRTLNIKTGQVRTTSYGTPVLNIASSFVKLPNDENFAKDICDVINFENLPNSTGKFKEIRSLLKKVKSEVDRIQES